TASAWAVGGARTARAVDHRPSRCTRQPGTPAPPSCSPGLAGPVTLPGFVTYCHCRNAKSEIAVEGNQLGVTTRGALRQEAEEVVEELRAALARAGIRLPSRGADPVSLAREAPCPLVAPGRCSVETAG